MTTNRTTAPKIERSARLKWVPIDKIKVNPLAQRDVNQSRVDHLVANLDLDQLGNPVVSQRDGAFWVLDGQHRIEAMRAFGFDTEPVQCWVHEGLDSEQEAEVFLKLNDVLPVSAFDRFTKAVHAGRTAESDIDRIVKSVGCLVTRDKVDNGIGAVAALRYVYSLGPGTLARTLATIRDAYGTGGFDNSIIRGIGLVCSRYDAASLDAALAVQKLQKAARGADGLLQKAEIVRRTTGVSKSVAVAAAAVETINGSGKGRKIPSWWKVDAEAAA